MRNSLERRLRSCDNKGKIGVKVVFIQRYSHLFVHANTLPSTKTKTKAAAQHEQTLWMNSDTGTGRVWTWTFPPESRAMVAGGVQKPILSALPMSCYLTTLTLTLICKRPGNTCATFQFQKQNIWTYNLTNKYRLLHRWTLIYQHWSIYLSDRSCVYWYNYWRSRMIVCCYDCQSQSHDWGGRTNHNNDSLPSENVSDLNQGWSLPNMWSIRW